VKNHPSTRLAASQALRTTARPSAVPHATFPGPNPPAGVDPSPLDPAQLAYVLDESPDMHVLVEVDGSLGYVSRGSLRLFGYEPAELTGVRFASMLHPSDLRQFESDLRGVQTGGDEVTSAYRLRHKDGRFIRTETALRIGCEAGSPRAKAVGVVRDVSERLSAELSLRESAERLRQLIDGVLEYAISMLDLEGLVTTWNHGAERMKGYGAEEIIGRNFSVFYTQDDLLEGAPAHALEIAAAKGTFEAEGWQVRKDGSRLWASVVVNPVHDSAGRLIGYAMVTRDVTARKEADEQRHATEADLTEANRRMLMAEEMAHVGHWRQDLLSSELTWSDEIFRTHGVSRSASLTLDDTIALYDESDRERIKEFIRCAVDDGTPYTFESRIKRPDGTFRDVVMNGRLERAPDGTPVGIIGVFHDVTELKRKDRERERLIERVTLATAAGRVGIWDLDFATNKVVCDPNMCALYGIAESTRPWTFAFWAGAIHPDDRAETIRKMAEAGAGGALFNHEFRIVWENGNIRHNHAQATVLRDGAGASRMVGTIFDITEIRDLAQQLRNEKDRLIETVEQLVIARKVAEQANLSKSAFLARMSHEIRTPMNGMLGFATILLDGTLTTEQRRQLTHLDQAGKSLLTIINDVLDFSKIEAGKLELQRTALSPAAVVDGALSIVRVTARAKGLAVNESFDDIPAWVLGDPTRLRQILLNLLTNAVKFTDRGTVGVRVSRDPANESSLQFEISDTGIGIPLGSEHLLFENFSQLYAKGRQMGGTGLGLAISKRLAEAMEGTMWMSRNPAGGSTFLFTALLPEVEAPVAGAPDVRKAIVPRRILVAEDNAVNQIVVETLLTHDGHEVVLVADGAEALEAVKASHFDLLFMDMEMPVMKGDRAARLIRESGPEGRKLPIIALTANALAEQIRQCRDAGMNDHLAKPIDRELLRMAVANWGGRGGDSREPIDTDVPIESADFDAHMLLELFDGSLAAVTDLLDAARTSIDNDMLRIERGTAAKDPSEVAAAAHRLKGTSGSISAQRLCNVSAAIERAATQDLLPAVSPLLVELRAAATATTAAITSFSRPAAARKERRTAR
jgi:PAS domain S-box-containing protein